MRRPAVVLVAALTVSLFFAAGSSPGEAGSRGTRTVSSVNTPAPAAVDFRLDPALRPLRTNRLDAGFVPGRADITIEVDGGAIRYDVMAIVVLPGRPVDLKVRTPGGFRLIHADGAVSSAAPGHWLWTPPKEPGFTALRIEDSSGSPVLSLNALVAHPGSAVVDGALNGYRIGTYRDEPLAGDPNYLPPEAFVEVAPGDEDLLVSPHFTIGQFLCKQDGDPRYLAISVPLLEKLEAVLEATNAAGYATPTFAVMSGFRTPAYNRAIGNTTDYSRHLWGDAADIFIDVDGNGDMDDLNGDGRSDLEDAGILSAIVERVMLYANGGILPGGLALYRRNAAHGPFVHVDARGTRARW